MKKQRSAVVKMVCDEQGNITMSGPRWAKDILNEPYRISDFEIGIEPEVG